jgi:hypothetical protein
MLQLQHQLHKVEGRREHFQELSHAVNDLESQLRIALSTSAPHEFLNMLNQMEQLSNEDLRNIICLRMQSAGGIH